MTRAQRNTLLLLLAAAARQAVCQITAPAPAPKGVVASTRCNTCPTAAPTDARTLYLSILVETDVAQFYSYHSEGAILVYFVARATFSVAPTQLQLKNFIIEHGASVVVYCDAVQLLWMHVIVQCQMLCVQVTVILFLNPQIQTQFPCLMSRQSLRASMQ